jgi:hypothetical protein
VLVRRHFLMEANNDGGGGSAGGDGNDKGGAAATTTDTKPAQSNTTGSDIDLSTLSGDQLAKVLENKELWNLPRIKELRDGAAEAKKLKDAQAAAEEESLKNQKKFEELATKRGDEVTTLKKQLETRDINQALTLALVKENAVDVDGALKLADRSKLSIDENGVVSGVEEALTALKTEKAYLFTTGDTKPTSVGSATNPNNGGGPSGPAKFKSSQITPEFFKANEAEINTAYSLGLIEDDGPPPQQ